MLKVLGISMVALAMGCAPQAAGDSATTDALGDGTSAPSGDSTAPLAALFQNTVRCRLTAYAPFNDAMGEWVSGTFDASREADGSVLVEGPMYKVTPSDAAFGVESQPVDSAQADSDVAFVVFVRTVGASSWQRLRPVTVTNPFGGLNAKAAVDFFRSVSFADGRMTGTVPGVYEPSYSAYAIDPSVEMGFFPIPADGDLVGTRDFQIQLTEAE